MANKKNRYKYRHADNTEDIEEAIEDHEAYALRYFHENYLALVKFITLMVRLHPKLKMDVLWELHLSQRLLRKTTK